MNKGLYLFCNDGKGLWTHIMPKMKYGKSAMTTKINIAMWKNAKSWKIHVKRTHKFDKAIKYKNAIAFLIKNAMKVWSKLPCLEGEFCRVWEKTQNVENQVWTKRFAMADWYQRIVVFCMMNLMCVEKHKKFGLQLWTRHFSWQIRIKTCHDEIHVN